MARGVGGEGGEGVGGEGGEGVGGGRGVGGSILRSAPRMGQRRP